MGNGFSDAYYITVILLIPAIFEICINVWLSVLRATYNLKFRTMILVMGLILNSTITLFGVPRWGYYIAAIGTAVSILLGDVITMSTYYYKKYDFHPVHAYIKIFSRTWISIIIQFSCFNNCCSIL